SGADRESLSIEPAAPALGRAIRLFSQARVKMRVNRWVQSLVSVADPTRLLALHRRLQVAVEATAGPGVRVTHRTQIFNHSHAPERLILGAHVLLDCTLEIYEDGTLTIGDHSNIGRARIYASRSVAIGRWVYVSDNCAIMDSDLHPMRASLRRATSEAWAQGRFPDVYSGVRSAPVSIGDHAWLGFGCAVLKGVRVGEGAIIAAGSIVTHDVPDWTIAAGKPAAVIRELTRDER
ncbi:MAG: acyltransferase, partial [Polyangiaceae bacterium]